MTDSLASPESDRLTEKIAAGIDHAKPASVGTDPDTTLGETAKELLDVLTSTDALLQTIDLENIPDIIDETELPGLVDLDRLADAISTHNPDLVFDLSNLRRVVDTRELWNSVDLLEFTEAKRRLERELDDVLGEYSLPGGDSDSEAVADVKAFASSLRPEAAQALIQQEATAKVEIAREAVVEQHEALERQYASNAKRLGTSRGGGRVRNPTAVSLSPPGPIPDSVSTRLSTVPAAVPNTKIDPLARIYGRRWRKTGPRR